MKIAQSKTVRYSPRGKQTTSYWKARTIAERSLKISFIEPKEIDPNAPRRIREECNAWKPKIPKIITDLDRRPFQSKDQHQEALEKKLSRVHA